jgi:uncharacterized protein YdeI (YjbR/CyaY-like superfamily)
MNAAIAYDLPQQQPPTGPSLAIPGELRMLFEESPKMKASFCRLTDRDRRGFVRYIEETRSVMTRERRAAIVAMSLIGLARDMNDDGSPVDS